MTKGPQTNKPRQWRDGYASRTWRPCSCQWPWLTTFGRQYKSESPFDKLVGNLLREAYQGEVALVPGVGYGISLKPGMATSEDIYKLLPHPSKIATLSLTGKLLLQTLGQTAHNLKPANKSDPVGLLQLSGIRYTLDLGNRQANG